MRANWIKIVFFVLGIMMLAGIAQVFLDPGLGTADESRRTKHPAGFSGIPPLGWGASIFYHAGPTSEDFLRISPERSTGRQPSMFMSRWQSGQKPAADDETQPTTFQGKPATLYTHLSRHSYVWRVDFERDGIWYRVGLENPVELEVDKSPLKPFLESFRVEPIFALTDGSTTQPAAASPMLPTTEPASR